MADPKYEGLPGIVYDQPDVYETSDLPESEQEFHDADSGESNPSFEVIHTSGSEAMEKFKGKHVDASNVDFSDRISKYNRTGYFTNRPIEWCINTGGDETVVQKFQRLQCEVNQLQQEIHQLQGTVAHGDGNVSVTALGRNVDELHSTLLGLNLEEALGKDMLSSLAEPEVALQKKLVHLLENLKNVGLMHGKEGKGGVVALPAGPPGEAVTYEIYYAPEQAKFKQMARAAKIESRLDALESLLGNDPEKMSSLSAWTNHRSLLGALRVLSGRLALLDPAHLDHIEGRLHALHTKMNAVAEKKAAVEEADRQSKINDLYEMVKKCEVLYSTLPEVVDRLASVENLHQEAAQFTQSLKQLDAVQTQLSSNLQSNGSLLTAVQEKFLQNLDFIQKNMTSLEERVQKLAKQKK